MDQVVMSCVLCKPARARASKQALTAYAQDPVHLIIEFSITHWSICFC
jgi:polyisoprenoid-binding protein YceI